MRIEAVIMMQILPFADDRALAAYRQFERAVYLRTSRPDTSPPHTEVLTLEKRTPRGKVLMAAVPD
jgi:hypothetical protein